MPLPPSMRNRALLLASLLLTGCGHSDAYVVAGIPQQEGPLAANDPVRLTFDTGKDRFPTLAPDDRTLWFSFQSVERTDGDRCLASMPAAGGTRTEYCLLDFATRNVRDGFDQPTPGPGGRLLYARFTSDIGAFLPDSGSLLLADVASPLTARTLLRLPTNIDGVGFTYIGRIRWLAPDRFIFVGEDMSVRRICGSCAAKDTIYRGSALIDGRLTATGAAFAVIPGSISASDFAISSAGDSLYFSQTDDDPVVPPQRSNRIFVIPVGGGTARIVYTGTPGDTIYSVARIGGRLAVTSKGAINAVDLTAGTLTNLARAGSISGASGFGMVSASSDGCTLLAEFRRAEGFAHTTDLYRLGIGGAPCV